MERVDQFVILSLFLLMTLMILYTHFQEKVWGDSPSFPIQQIFDDIEDWNISVNSSEIAKSTEVAD